MAINIGFNTILTLSLNLINGYMGEFSVGHAGFLAGGAYIASYFTVKVIPWCSALVVSPGRPGRGSGAALIGLIVAFPSFKTRGVYRATGGDIFLAGTPLVGRNPCDIFRIIVEINQAGTTILLVEQNAHLALSIASRAYVLETGRIILSGTGRELLGDPRVKEAYLGC